MKKCRVMTSADIAGLFLCHGGIEDYFPYSTVSGSIRDLFTGILFVFFIKSTYEGNDFLIITAGYHQKH